MNYVRIEFKKEDELSRFVESLMKSENGKDCFVKIDHNGICYCVDLKPEF